MAEDFANFEGRRHGVRFSQGGFTLIELLIVMIILGLLAALVAPKMFQKVGTSKQKAAKAQISMLGTALDAFRLDVGGYPSTETGLEALRKNPGLGGWDGPYLSKDVPKALGAGLMSIALRVTMAIMTYIPSAPTARKEEKGENADVLGWD